MSSQAKIVVGGIVVTAVTLWLLPAWVAVTIIAVVLGLPVVAYLALDPSQRRRLRGGRRQIGR